MPTPKVRRMTEGAVERQRFLAAYKGFRFVRHPPAHWHIAAPATDLRAGVEQT